LKLLNQGEFKLIIFFFSIQCQGSEANEKEYIEECEKPGPRKESRPDVQDDIQEINDQQGEEVCIDPGMRKHLFIYFISCGMRKHGPVSHLDGLDDDEEEDFEYTDNEDDLWDLEYKEITAFTQLMKGKGKDHNSTTKCHRGQKPSRSMVLYGSPSLAHPYTEYLYKNYKQQNTKESRFDRLCYSIP
jgi:hypothetical protein